MTDNDTTTPTSTTTPESEEAAGAASTSEQRATRTRTRSRTTSRPPRTTSSSAKAATDAADASPAEAKHAKNAKNTKNAKSAGGAGGDEASAESASDDSRSPDAPSDGDGGGPKRRRRRGGRGRGGRRTGSETSGDSGEASSPGSSEGADGSDDDVASQIERGGTRVAAAKRGRSAGSGRSGGSGRRPQAKVGGVAEDVRRAMLDGPPRTMLVTQRPDRTQIAVVEDRTVVEHFVTRNEDVTYVGNIYMGRVQNVLPGMEAAFLDIGKGRNGVLYAGEVLYDELDLEEGADERIENVLKPGQTVLVQVTKDPMGTKGPRLTMRLSLAGRYLVLAPNSDLFGISRKLTDKERDRLRKIVKRSKPAEHGVIVRTAAEDATEPQLTADLQRLLAKWDRVAAAAEDAKALDAVYEEPPLVVKVIRDTFGAGFERCVVDDEALYHQVRNYLEEVAPELLPRLELYGQPARATTNGDATDGEDAADTTADTASGMSADTAPASTAGAPASASDDAADPTTPDAESAAAPAADASGDSGTSASPDDADSDDPTSDDGKADAAEGSDTSGDTRASSTKAPVAHSASSTASTPVAGDDEIPAPLTAQELAVAAQRREELGALFDAYGVSEQLRKAMSRKVWLPSGGYLIVESTEAMKVIDVNTGKFTGDGDTNLEEVVLKTNLEAAEEIVHQLRLRDMGGIIIIDFIDMLLKANQDQVVRRLKRELLRDRTKTRVSEVSRLGLVQMTRKNVSQGLVESFSHPCDHCDGRGIISELD